MAKWIKCNERQPLEAGWYWVSYYRGRGESAGGWLQWDGHLWKAGTDTATFGNSQDPDHEWLDEGAPDEAAPAAVPAPNPQVAGRFPRGCIGAFSPLFL